MKIKTYRVQQKRFLNWVDIGDYKKLKDAKAYIKMFDDLNLCRIIKLDYKSSNYQTFTDKTFR